MVTPLAVTEAAQQIVILMGAGVVIGVAVSYLFRRRDKDIRVTLDVEGMRNLLDEVMDRYNRVGREMELVESDLEELHNKCAYAETVLARVD